jgi:hypothetical protein
MARPSLYCIEIADEICERISEGESLRAVCRDDRMPNKATVFRWLIAHQEFSDQYACARDTQADVLADEIIDIADESMNDSFVDENGITRTNQDAIARSRLRVDARKWVASKLKPKVYGEKSSVETKIDGTVKFDNVLNVVLK